MSMHFVPQWVKQPIKPSGSTAMAPGPAEQSPSALNSSQSHLQKPTQNTSAPTSTSVPFPALSGSNSNSNSNAPAAFSSNAPMSYSRATHTPVSPGFPTDGSYFPSSDSANGGATAPNPYPFRYSRERMLALYDDEKVKTTPIELVELLEANSVLVAPQAKRPVSMRDRSELEKKLLSTSVHPPSQPRRNNQNQSQNSSNAGPANHEPAANGNTPRRGVANITRDPTQPNGRGFGGFGRGEGGALGSAVPKSGVIGGGVVPPPGEGKAPGVLGGGFGGVGKRLVRGRGDGAEGTPGSSDTARPWRATRTASGSFEGVLGFGGPATATPSQPPVDEEHDNPSQPMMPVPQTAPITGSWRERLAAKQGARKEDDTGDQSFGSASLHSTGTQKQWRAPIGQIGQGGPTVAVDVPVPEAPSSMSVIASPAATPMPDRDASLSDLPESVQQMAMAAIAPHILPEDIEWYYQDPQGNEHGPFEATAMQQWHGLDYFNPDTLPIRRAHEREFFMLAELQRLTGSTAEPFITPIPRPAPPPGLAGNSSNSFAPPPQQFQQVQPPTGPFQDLAIGSPFGSDPRHLGHPQAPMPMQPFLQQRPPQSFGDSPFNNQFMSGPGPREDAFQTPGPGFGGPQGSPWGGMPLQQPLGSRFNGMGAFGSPGVPSPIGAMPAPFPPQGAFSPAIGQQLARGPEFFSPSVGVGSIPTSPWGAPQPQQHQGQIRQQPMQTQPQPFPEQQQGAPMAWQQQQQPSPMQPLAQPEQAAEQPSYFPQVAQEATPATSVQELESSYQQSQYQPKEQSVQEEEASLEQQEPEAEQEPEPEVEVEKPTTGPPPSAWAPVPAVSRKSSVAEAAPTPAQATVTPDTPGKLPAPPASLPSKPAVTQPTPEADVITPVQTATPDKAGLPSKPAPWASVKDERDTKSPSGPSLREIQQAEAKAASARKQAIAEARANNAIPSPAISASDDMPTSMSWGLPQQGSKGTHATTPSVTTPSAPVWGAGEAAAPKKTLKQIQEEEEKRRVKLAAAKAQAQGSPAATPSASGGTPAAAKRGYADLAATSAPSPAGAGWQTVGAGGKGANASPSVSRVASSAAAKPAVSTPVKPATPAPAMRAAKTNAASSDDSTPSVEFIRWTKQSLNGLNVNIDEFIQMLLSFPIDPPASERAGQLEIIQDSVYANSSTLDGRRFAQEFYTRRKADAKRSSQPNANGATPTKSTSLADVLKTQPKPQSIDAGFKVVKAKNKKKN